MSHTHLAERIEDTHGVLKVPAKARRKHTARASPPPLMTSSRSRWRPPLRRARAGRGRPGRRSTVRCSSVAERTRHLVDAEGSDVPFSARVVHEWNAGGPW